MSKNVTSSTSFTERPSRIPPDQIENRAAGDRAVVVCEACEPHRVDLGRDDGEPAAEQPLRVLSSPFDGTVFCRFSGREPADLAEEGGDLAGRLVADVDLDDKRSALRVSLTVC